MLLSTWRRDGHVVPLPRICLNLTLRFEDYGRKKGHLYGCVFAYSHTRRIGAEQTNKTSRKLIGSETNSSRVGEEQAGR